MDNLSNNIEGYQLFLGKQLCEATFPYKAQNEDELSFQEGDLITITNKECPDPGWWHGELNGKTGVFPDNFVVLIDNRNSNKEVRKSIGDKGMSNFLLK